MKGLFQCPPWARSFCPFRACGAKLAKVQGYALLVNEKVQGFVLLVNEFGYFCIMISRKS